MISAEQNLNNLDKECPTEEKNPDDFEVLAFINLGSPLKSHIKYETLSSCMPI